MFMQSFQSYLHTIHNIAFITAATNHQTPNTNKQILLFIKNVGPLSIIFVYLLNPLFIHHVFVVFVYFILSLRFFFFDCPYNGIDRNSL